MGRSIPVSSAGNVFHVSPIFIYTSDNTRGSSHTLVQSAGNVFFIDVQPAYISETSHEVDAISLFQMWEMFSQINLDFTYIRDLTQVKSRISVMSAGNTFQ
ncbi:unnamed protein product [Staurois parvus]|uniref:Uncharacterized protein n=1 Tax=Staurois parvus TaxID=386267 RepID=A0ABN9B9X5_9NEOB|nr:unnamed protein product [Staurois parvus]